MYIKITNKCENVNRLKLEKLGFSTKRNDDSTIGQFGSGIKFAPISAVRKGIPFIFAGSDDRGEYILRYVVKDDDGVPSIYYKYEDYEKPSSFTSEAGSLSWETEYQIYREVIANAIDEARVSGTDWDIKLVNDDDIVVTPGEFSVYLGATPSMLEVHFKFDAYFSVDRTPLFEFKSEHFSFKLYEPYDENFRVYCKGMMVYSSENRNSKWGGEPLFGLFDYEFDDLRLNEERSVKSEFDMNVKIMTAITSLNREDLISRVLEEFLTPSCNLENMYEVVSIPAYCYSNKGSTVWDEFNEERRDTWLSTFDKMFGKSILVMEDSLNLNIAEAIRSRGYEALAVDRENIFDFFKIVGVKEVADLFGDDLVYNYSMGFSAYENISKAVHILEKIYGADFDHIPELIGTYQDDENQSLALAMTTYIPISNGDKERVILINTEVEDQSIQSIIATIVHEWDHYDSYVGDGDYEGRRFRNLADKRIGELIYRLWLTKTGTI